MSLTSKGNFPTICAASVWKKALASFAISPISLRGWSVPISLLTAMTLTRRSGASFVSSHAIDAQLDAANAHFSPFHQDSPCPSRARPAGRSPQNLPAPTLDTNPKHIYVPSGS